MDDEKIEAPKLYTLEDDQGNPSGYAFGPSWVATAMWTDDLIFPTEDEAVLYWYHNLYYKGAMA